MLFPTIEFAIFFALVFPLSWMLQHRRTQRKLLLLTGSYIFYGAWDWRFTLLLFQCSMFNYGFGRWLQSAPEAKRKRIVTLAVVSNLATLGFFKYYGFFLTSFSDLLGSLGFERDIHILEIVLPVGISFFTFQGMSYVIDVYRRELKVSTNPIDVLLYISFFPQLVAGPIVRAKTFFKQLREPLDSGAIPVAFATRLILLGLFKKVVVANYLATMLVDEVFQDPSNFGAVDVLFGVYGYAIQIYCDFSAYSDIAIGVAALLGYQFEPNFDRPYRAHSLKNFWRRWHISLSSWLRDYLYISLGGSRGGRVKTYRNLLLTMLLGGLWHGAAWNFVIWGALHGSALAVERFALEHLGLRWKRRLIVTSFQIFLVFHFVCFTWIFFRAETFDLSIEILRSLGNFEAKIAILTPFTASLILLPFAFQFLNESFYVRLEKAFGKLTPSVQGLVIGIILTILSGVSPEGVAPFIYFQF